MRTLPALATVHAVGAMTLLPTQIAYIAVFASARAFQDEAEQPYRRSASAIVPCVGWPSTSIAAIVFFEAWCRRVDAARDAPGQGSVF
ncbi:hypothetical protein FA95DRAFT_1606041 [Auriscalpium vulgare]|uniref:Uncharacterized protein n=1 Tax=Auriscalpium vulgare TaxID=40419 RepID=A0ACB8RTE7_9AGAM|nr:hypothetical protein FA95DRAFT_1606041 [Auriscalpium vulgare]